LSSIVLVDLLHTLSETNIMSEIAFVTPKSKKAFNRFHNLMEKESQCFIEQNKGNRVFLRSFNGRNFFWVNLQNDNDWGIEF
jgi:hypothetical protein